MFGHVGRGAAILAAQRQALEQAQSDEDDRRGNTNGRVTGQYADNCGGDAHDDDGDEEGVFAPDHVAETAEHNGSERPHREPGGEGKQGEDKRGGFVNASEEVLGDDRCQRAIKVKVVPLENRAQG
ncbi:hypothetical protein D3C72_361380 [compost metagenome]